MSKFTNLPTNVRAPITGVVDPTLRTQEGGAGHARDVLSELYLLAVTNFVSEASFYETAATRDTRFEELVHEATRTDPDWVRRFARYLRGTLHMRSASIVLAAEYTKTRLEGFEDTRGREVVDSVLQRPDEPAEMLAYWRSRHGRNVPKPIKRGVADAVRRLFTERAVIKWDGTGKAWRFADVNEIVHPKPVAPWQSQLFKWLLDQRHHNDGNLGELTVEGSDAIDPAPELTLLKADRRLLAIPEDRRRALAVGGSPEFDAAGWNWERLAGWIPGGMDAAAWEAVIPNMGYMALLRNLRNFDQANISEDANTQITVKLTNPDEVARSKQFPYRFYSAYKAIPGLRWAYALERAMLLSLVNVPALSGKTLVMLDVSGSMTHEGYLNQFHPQWRANGRNQGTLPWEMAAIFGIALTMKAREAGGSADMYAYGTVAQEVEIPRGGALLRIMETIPGLQPFHTGTETLKVADVLANQNGKTYDRIVILTDEQAFAAHPLHYERLNSVPRIYTFNMAGYKAGHMPSGGHGRYTFGGLTDAAFDLLPALEGFTDGRWPF